MLGEDDELPRPAVPVGGKGVVLENRRQLGPLPVGAGIADRLGRLDQVSKFNQLGVEFLHRLGGGRGVEELLLNLLDLFRVVLIVIEVARVDGELALTVGAVEDLLLPALQPL